MNEKTAVLERCEQVEKIVAYPEDFGLNRSRVAGLARALAQERHMLQPQLRPADAFTFVTGNHVRTDAQVNLATLWA